MAKERVSIIVKLIVSICCLALILQGQKQIGPTGLSMMLIGLAGLIVLLYLYNKKYA